MNHQRIGTVVLAALVVISAAWTGENAAAQYAPPTGDARTTAPPLAWPQQQATPPQSATNTQPGRPANDPARTQDAGAWARRPANPAPASNGQNPWARGAAARPEYSVAQAGPARPVDGHASVAARPTAVHPAVAQPQKLYGVAALRTLTKAPDEHPLTPLVRWAASETDRIEAIKDYQGFLVKQENINGELKDAETAFFKIRHKPFSVYLHFIEPKGKKGTEALYVSGQNDGKLFGHGVGWEETFGTQALDPNGWLAMRGNKYPITEIGILNLVEKFIEIGAKDSKYPECSVRIYPSAAKVNGRPCTCIQVIHPTKQDYFTFYKANIFIDEELNLPIRYEAYEWPQEEGGAPVLQEAYTYLKLELNKGLTDADFSTQNPNYKF